MLINSFLIVGSRTKVIYLCGPLWAPGNIGMKAPLWALTIVTMPYISPSYEPCGTSGISVGIKLESSGTVVKLGGYGDRKKPLSDPLSEK